jgi:hypothetical protein
MDVKLNTRVTPICVFSERDSCFGQGVTDAVSLGALVLRDEHRIALVVLMAFGGVPT